MSASRDDGERHRRLRRPQDIRKPSVRARSLVSRLVDSLAVAGDRFEDLLGGLSPDVRSWVLVPVLDPGADVFVERADARMCAAAARSRASGSAQACGWSWDEQA